ncbi:MAG: hypothetical protein WCJ01_05310 [Ignavibacteria bacterium]
MKIHYYMLCYRFEALVASHLDPEAFGLYMSVGTQKNTRGNVLFFEVTPDINSPYFRLNDIENRCVPHKDGSPKRSKYISIYRVLEHLPVSSFGRLYLTTADGRVLALESTNYNAQDKGGANLYQELCPVSPMVVSHLAPETFVKFMTNPANPVNLPRIFFSDMRVDMDTTGHLAGNLPYTDPMHIVDCIQEVATDPDKKQTKTVSRNPQIHGFFRTIRRGFFLGDQTELKFYAFPELGRLEIEHAKWWRSASESMVS